MVAPNITIRWNHDGLCQGFTIYRDTASFDAESLPLPLATLDSKAREYADEDIIEDETYFYRVAAYYGDATKLSEELEYTADLQDGDPYWGNVVALYHFDEDKNNLASNDRLTLTYSGNTYQDAVFGKGLLCNGRTTTPVAILNSSFDGLSDYPIELYFCIKNYTSGSAWIFDGRKYQEFWASNKDMLGLYATQNGGKLYLTDLYSGAELGAYYVEIETDKFYHLAVSYDASSTTVTTFLDGIQQSKVNWNKPVRVSRMCLGAYGYGTGNNGSQSSPSSSNCIIDELRITKGVARYSENFTLPTEPFPN